MRKLILSTLMPACLMAACLIAAQPAHAGLFDKSPEKAAAQAEADGLSAATIWVDASWGFRNQGAANNLSRAHQAFALHGYRIVSVDPYIENGDLQGFFATYQKPE